MAGAKASDKPNIVIKRYKKAAHGHHGGAWKIAYADFVTAMMAFFLLMWLLGSTAKGDLQGISDYFNTPLKVALSGGSGSGDATSILRGGGTSLTRSAGQVRNGENPAERRSMNLQAARSEIERQDGVRLKALQDKVSDIIDSNEALRQFREQIKIDITAEGLRVQIVDRLNRPMFDTGKTALKEYTRDILRALGKVLNEVDYRISLAGHTDAAPYASGGRGYSNWELSADRANISRRELIVGGMDERKIVRVVGLASSVPFDAKDPFSAENRRISILVLNKRTEEMLLRDGNVSRVAAMAQPPGIVAIKP
jgi:chemotaxis protein MotB